MSNAPEITLEMSDAGSRVLSRIKDDVAEGHVSLRDAVHQIYRAMYEAQSSRETPSVLEAFEILAERSSPPQHRDTPAYRRLCRAVIDENIDRIEVARTGKPAMWTHGLEATRPPRTR